MYAVVEIQGSQFKVEKDQKLFVNRIDAKEGSKISFAIKPNSSQPNSHRTTSFEKNQSKLSILNN